MNYIQKVMKKYIERMRLETATELDLKKAISLWSKLCSTNSKQNSSHCKHEGVQDHIKYTLEDYKNCLEKNVIKLGRLLFF